MTAEARMNGNLLACPGRTSGAIILCLAPGAAARRLHIRPFNSAGPSSNRDHSGYKLLFRSEGTAVRPRFRPPSDATIATMSR